jgi:hypothetical protein
MGHVMPGTPPLFAMWDSKFLAMVGASFESRNSGPHRSGRRRGLSMQQQHRQGVGVVIVLSV